jgi:hypothetical protein
LATLANTTPEAKLRDIVYHDRDVLHARNPETGDVNSLTLKLAAQQVAHLRSLVAFSANSERDPRPYFGGGELSVAKRMVEHYRFGHTYAGSFGFTIESTVPPPRPLTTQLYLLPDDDEPVQIAPVQRRVMERIARGLSITKQATNQREPELIVDHWADGFNYNMCRAVVGMSQEKRYPVEFLVNWSPLIEPPQDLATTQPVMLRETSYNYLTYAADKLRNLKPETVTIRGRVTDLSATDNPLGLLSDRTVAIRWTSRPDGRPISVLVTLESPDHYVAATNAHLSWDTVEVKGVLRPVGRLWRLTDPKEFRVLPRARLLE